MRICIYGAGVIGSIFAVKLARKGHDISVLARGKRLEEIAQNGISAKHIHGDKTETAHVKPIGILEPNDIYDYIIVTMQRRR